MLAASSSLHDPDLTFEAAARFHLARVVERGERDPIRFSARPPMPRLNTLGQEECVLGATPDKYRRPHR